MTHATPALGDPLSVSTFRQAVAACDQFEAAFRAGERPNIEGLLAGCSERPKLLRMLVELECDLRREVGETPSPAEYLTRFPGDAAAVRAAFLDEDAVVGPPPRLGKYELLDEIGRGGMAVVYRAKQRGAERFVALKLIRSDLLADPRELRERFRTEARSAALEHDHIVRVYDIGEEAEWSFIVMELVEGLSLADTIRNRPLSNRLAAELVAKVARAVQHAHTRGVLHRDLKPQNILLDTAGEPYVTDFGLARRLDASQDLTPTGAMLGTPAYMAPEQAVDAAAAGARADVYSLGATLYECLTGRRVFAATNVIEILRCLRDEEPTPPRRLVPAVARDLETICLKCLEKQPARRYESAAALADDLEAYLRGRPIRARPLGPAGRLAKLARRQRVAVAFAAMLALGAMAGVAGYLSNGQQVRDARAVARANGLVATLLTADASQVSRALTEVQACGGQAAEALASARAEHPPASSQHFRAALATFPLDSSVGEYLFKRGCAGDPDDVALVRTTVGPKLSAWAARLRVIVADPGQAARPRLRAASLLVVADPAWADKPGDVAGLAADLAADATHAPDWARLLRPLRAALEEPLTAAFAGRSGTDAARTASAALAELFADDADRLLTLALDASPDQFAPLAGRLAPHAPRALACVGERLEQPAPSEEALLERRANALLLRLALGETAPTDKVLGFEDDPRARALFVHRPAAAGVPAVDVVNWYDHATDAGVRQALLLTLGEYPPATARHVFGDAGIARLMDTYRHEPHPGVRSAAGWLLRRWSRGDGLRAVDRELAGRPPVADQRWCVNRVGMTEVLFPAVPAGRRSTTPVGQFPRVGPPDAFGPFAIAATETTVDQFWRYLEQEPAAGGTKSPRPSVDPDLPVTHVMAPEAERYCNWLSRLRGLPPDQWCYEPDDPEKPDGEMRLRAGYRRLAGYRLPTEAEWEYACLSERPAKEFFIPRIDLLGKYSWFKETAKGRTYPVGQLKPNEFGLFDGWGNVSEWCADRYLDRAVEVQTFRGLSYEYAAGTWATYPRGLSSPVVRMPDIGFRVARSLFDSSTEPRGATAPRQP